MNAHILCEDLRKLIFKGNKKLNRELRKIYHTKAYTLKLEYDDFHTFKLKVNFEQLLLDFIGLYTKNGTILWDAKLNLNKRLISAVLKNDVQEAKVWLAKGAKLFAGPERRFYPLIKWVFWRNNVDNRKDMLELLFENGLDIQFRDENGCNLLHMLCLYSDEYDLKVAEIAELLINYGASPTEINDRDEEPLKKAISLKNIPLVSLFINHGSGINRLSKYGEFPLKTAVLSNNLKLLSFLISNDAKVNFKSNNGDTALHEACFLNFEEVIEFLIRKGADISAVDKSGETPFSRMQRFKSERYEKCVITMVKVFSKMSHDELEVHESDMYLIRTIPEARHHYENCIIELDKMANTKFYGNHTYYSALNMLEKNKKLAYLTLNKKFVENFKKNLYDFTYFEIDLRRVLNDARRVRNELNVVHQRLKSMFGNFLPDTVLRKLRDSLTIQDLPLNQVMSTTQGT